MAAIAWSYAATLHLNIDPAVLFHNSGYKGDAENLLENFQAGRYIGAPLLQWYGMTIDGTNEEKDRAAYPKMIHWLRPQKDQINLASSRKYGLSSVQ